MLWPALQGQFQLDDWPVECLRQAKKHGEIFRICLPGQSHVLIGRRVRVLVQADDVFNPAGAQACP